MLAAAVDKQRLEEFQAGQTLNLESVCLALPVAAIYEEVDFSEPGAPPAAP